MKVCVLSFFLIFLATCCNGQIPGGLSPADVTSPEIVRLSQVALVHLKELNKKKNLTETETNLVEILDAKVQVVSGFLTILTLKVTEGESPKKCVVKIWEQSWLNKTEITEAACDDFIENVEEEKVSVQNKVELTPQEKSTSEEKKVEQMSEEKVSSYLFNQFIKKYNKVYNDIQEFNTKFHVFRANLKKIKHLRETEQGTGQYGITKFADLTSTEFKKYLGLKKPDKVKELPMAVIPDVELPSEFDWRKHHAVTSVKDQKSCGSCWAFSAVGNIEGQWAIKKGQLLSLSEQELVDCDKKDNGCSGGFMTTAFEQIKNMGGLETERDYPYDAKDEKCHLEKSEIRVKISGAVNLTQSEYDIAKWVFKNGPVSAALNANAMQFYMGGVSHPYRMLCSPDNLDHGVLIVGFGVHRSAILKRILPYWLIKNSWGERWGERGYYRLYRGDGSCGINQAVSSAIVN